MQYFHIETYQCLQMKIDPFFRYGKNVFYDWPNQYGGVSNLQLDEIMYRRRYINNMYLFTRQ